MTNPSTIWSQLALPNSPAGSMPYVSPVDLTSILIDALNFFYTDASGYQTLGTGQLANQLTVKNGIRIKYTDISATPGNGIIATIAGRAAYAAAGGPVLSITGAPVVVGDIIDVLLETIDATLTRLIAVCTVAGTITFTGNAAASAITKFSYVINKVY